MDNKSKIILQRYTDNPRITAATLSSELKLSKNAVIERIKSLKEKKNILTSTCFPNYFKLGFSQYLLFIKSPKLFQSQEIIKQIEKDPVVEILSLLGKYNLYLKFISPDDSYRASFVEKTVELLGAEDYELVGITNYDLIPAKKYYLEPKVIPKDYEPSNKYHPIINLDKYDLKIIKMLTQNSEQSLAFIAEELKISPQVVAYRFRRLLKENIILRCYGYTDIFNSNLQLYFLRFEMTKPSKAITLFKKFIKDPRIQDVSILNHKKNFFCTLESDSRKEMLDSIKNLLNLSKDIRSVEIDIFLDQLYYNFFPPILEKQNP